MPFYDSLFNMSIAMTLHQCKGHIILDNHNDQDDNKQSLNKLKNSTTLEILRDFKTLNFSLKLISYKLLFRST